MPENLPRVEIDDDTVRQLYAAATGQTAWPLALQRLCESMQTRFSQVVGLDKRTGTLLISEQPEHQYALGVLDYVREYHRVDPHGAYLMSQPIGQVLHTGAVFPRQSMELHRFYSEFWNAYGVKTMLGAKIYEDDQLLMLLGIHRAIDEPDFSAEDIARATRYVGHLVTALKVADAFERARAAATVGERILETSDRPMVLLDPTGRIGVANGLARELLAARTHFRERNGMLDGETAAGSRVLREALGQLHAPHEHQRTRRRALRIPGSDSTIALTSIWDMSPEATLGAFGANRIFLLSVVLAQTTQGPDPGFLAALFDLTPSEAQVVVLLASGRDLKAIAASQGVAISTVRSQLYSAMGKTQTSRQSDLVTKVLLATQA